MKKVYDVCLAKKNSKGEYVKNKEGKCVYKNFGAIVQDDKGYLNLVLETMHGDVWFTLFEVKENSVGQTVKEEFPEVTTDEVPF